MQFTVKDTGAGLQGKDPSVMFQSGIGLSNTQKRLHYLFGEDMYILPNIPTGAIVGFSIPKNKETEV